MRKIFNILRLLPLIVLGVSTIIWAYIMEKGDARNDPFGFNITNADGPSSSSSSGDPSSSSSSGD